MRPQKSNMLVENRLRSPGPKRLLAIDGVGARTAISIPILEAIEGTLQRATSDPDFRLSDYFDLIGGTGTGAVIAAALAEGQGVGETRDWFSGVISRLFEKQSLLQRFASTFRGEAVRQVLVRRFGDEPLRSNRFRTGLCIFAYRLDTQKPAVFHNFREEHFNARPLGLAECLHASIAMPTWFEPVPIEIAGETGVFINPDLSMQGGAAMPLFQTAISEREPFRWPTGEHELLLVSVGAGSILFRETRSEAQNRNLLGWVSSLPSLLLADAQWQNELFLRAISRCPQSDIPDEGMGAVDGDLLGSQRALTFIRYDANLNDLGALGLDHMATQVERISAADRIEGWPEWIRIGTAVADRQVDAKHFPSPFEKVQSFGRE